MRNPLLFWQKIRSPLNLILWKSIIIKLKYPYSKYERFKEIETNEEVLARRTKQISYGKNTSEYKTYRQQVPKSQRLPNQPSTPYKYQVCSRRSFDAQIKLWRIGLHHYHETTVDLEELMAPKIWQSVKKIINLVPSRIRR